MTGGFDPAMPNTGRVYSRLLGGKDHFAADRAEADVLLGIYPPLAEMVKENRAFLAEAVTWAASQGIGQFLDLGAGLPATPAVHQTARAVLPAARVAYVDRDPMVLSHARALLAAPGVAAVAADLRDPAVVLADPELAGCHRPSRAGVRHPRRGRAFPGRRYCPGGHRGVCPADHAGQLPGYQLRELRRRGAC